MKISKELLRAAEDIAEGRQHFIGSALDRKAHGFVLESFFDKCDDWHTINIKNRVLSLLFAHYMAKDKGL